MSLKFGIIGCGGIAASHLNAIKANGAEVVAVADINLASAQKFAEGIPGAKAFPCGRELLDANLVDAVCVCSTPNAHEEAAVRALEMGVHLLLEKPMANTLISARRIFDSSRKSSAKFMLAFRHRFIPAIQIIKEKAASGELGKLVLFHNTFCGPSFAMKDKWFSKKAISGGGSLLDTSSHSIDLFRFIVGEPEESHALTARHLEGTDVEDAAAMILKTADGAIGSLTASWVAGDGMAFVELIGEEGRIRYDYYTNELLFRKRGAPEPLKIEVPRSNGFNEELAEFIRSIESNDKPSVGAFDGLRGMEIINSAYERTKQA